MIIAGIALAGVGFFGLQGVQQKRSQQNAAYTLATNTTQTPLSSKPYTNAPQTNVTQPFPVQPPPNGLLKDKYLDLDRGMSASILERHNGIPAISSRKLDPPSPYAPTPQGQRVAADAIRDTSINTIKNSMSQFRNDETPVPKTLVGPGLGYDASVPASDGFHPRLRVVLRSGLNNIQLPGQMIMGKNSIDRATQELPVAKNLPQTYFEQSESYITGSPNAPGAGVSQPVVRLNFREMYTNRGTTLPGLKNSDGCNEVDEDTSRYGVGTGPAMATQTGAMSEEGYQAQTLRTTDRGWTAGSVWGSGPSPAEGSGAETTRSNYILKNQSRDETGFNPERIWAAGPSRPDGHMANIQDEARTTTRQLIPGLPVINTLPAETLGATQSSFRDVDTHREQVPVTKRANYASEVYTGIATGEQTSAYGAQMGSLERGKLASATRRQVIDQEMLNVSGPNAPVGNMVRHEFDTFALREVTTATPHVAGANASYVANTNRVSGDYAPEYKLPVPRVDMFQEGYMPNVGQPAVAGPIRPNVSFDPNRFENQDDRLEVAVETVPQHQFLKAD